LKDFLENLHPTLKKRLEEHIKQLLAKGVNATEMDIIRAGSAGSHGEIRALDKLLKEVDPTTILGDHVFNNIIGYNRFLRDGAVSIQPSCVHCFYLTDGVKFIGF
jgi:hypothetical protein